MSELPTVDIYADVPMDLLDLLNDYVEHGMHPGGAMLAFVSNDLFGTIKRADSTFLKHLRLLCLYVFNYLPVGAYGTPDRVEWWSGLSRAQRADCMNQTRHRAYYSARKHRAALLPSKPDKRDES